jgi:hypothetical protein
MEIEKVKDALAVGATVIASEHFFSTFLSSPLTVQTLYTNQPELVRKYLMEASLCSLIFSAIIAYLLKDPLAVYAGIGITLLYTFIYNKALSEPIIQVTEW